MQGKIAGIKIEQNPEKKIKTRKGSMGTIKIHFISLELVKNRKAMKCIEII